MAKRKKVEIHPNQRVLTIQQCATVLATSPASIRRMIADGALPAVVLRSGKFRTALRVNRDLVQDMARGRRVK